MNLIGFPLEEVMSILDAVDLLGCGEGIVERLHQMTRRKYVPRSLDEELGFGNSTEETHTRGGDRNSQAHEGVDARVAATDAAQKQIV